MNADDLNKRTSSILGGDQYDTKVVRNRATVTGACVGGLFGVYYGFSRKKNMLVYAGAGAVVGAILSRILVPK